MSFVPPQARARTFIAILALATIAQAKLGKVPGLMDSAEDQSFKQADVDASGELSLDEYKKMLSATFSSFGQADKFEGQDAQIAATFKTIDKDDSGGISYSEWHALVVQGRQKAEEAEKLRQAAHEEQVRLSFDMADKDKNGVLTQAEFFEGFSKYGYKEEQINDFFAKGNLDGDATLSYEEFQHARSAQANKQSDAASEEQQRAEFREADTDGNGEISSSEYLKTWQDFAREMGGAEALHAIKPEEIFDSFNSFDLDGSGNISEDEWVQVLRANAARAAEMQARQAKAEL